MNSESLTQQLRSYTAGALWIWLDLDDTIIDFRTNSLRALHLTYDATPTLQNIFHTPEEWTESYMRHNHALWDRYNRAEITQAYLRTHRFLDPICERTPVTEADFTPEAARLDTLYLDLLAQQTAMIDGARDLITHLRAHSYNIGILSNGFTDIQHRKLHTVRLDTQIDLIVLSDDIGINKPDPRLYHHAMERTGITDPAAHLMIGDNPATDIDGALRSGWRAIHYSPSAPSITLTPRGIVTPSLRPLPDILPHP